MYVGRSGGECLLFIQCKVGETDRDVDGLDVSTGDMAYRVLE